MDQTLEDAIIKVIRNHIEHEEGIGEKTGGSGHLSDISIIITKSAVIASQSQNYAYQVDIDYTKVVNTEFTYEPDNPPYEYYYSQTFFIGTDLEISGFAKKVSTGSNMDIEMFLPEDPEFD